jgi:ATP-dependent protease ClpP protease subunit
MSENKEIKDFGTETESSKETGIQVLSIIGQIEGHYVSDQNQKTTKYEHIIPLLVAMEQREDVKGILIILNTMGGDVEAGLGIAEMIASMTKPTVSLVIGGSHSIGVPLAVSAKHSFIVPSATMTIHPVRVNGLVVGAPQTYNYFADMQKRIVSFICRHSNATEQTINEMMMRPDMLATDVGTVLEGREAVACGLIDEIGGLSDALKKLNEMIKE